MTRYRVEELTAGPAVELHLKYVVFESGGAMQTPIAVCYSRFSADQIAAALALVDAAEDALKRRREVVAGDISRWTSRKAPPRSVLVELPLTELRGLAILADLGRQACSDLGPEMSDKFPDKLSSVAAFMAADKLAGIVRGLK